MAISIISRPFLAEANSIRSVETEGIVGFYGTYESLSEPKPGPPNGLKPILLYEKNPKSIKGRLPKLGELMSLNWIWFVITLLGIILFERQITSRIQLRSEMNHQ